VEYNKGQIDQALAGIIMLHAASRGCLTQAVFGEGLDQRTKILILFFSFFFSKKI
jgi:hypothetical protein